jgi:Mor family transcriptional regulator
MPTNAARLCAFTVLAHPREPAISPPYFAGMMHLLSNNSELTFTPHSLRKLAQIQGSRESPSEPGEFRVHRLSARLSTNTVDQIVLRYETGESARSLAQEFEIAPSALLRLLREQNVVVRQQVVSPELEQLMARDYEAGLTVAELKDKYAISHGAVLRALHRAGLEMRAKAPRKSMKRS